MNNRWFSLLNVKICCFSVSFMIINDESVCFGLFGQKKQSKDFTMGSPKLRWAFVTLLWHFISKMIDGLIVKIISRLRIKIIISCSPTEKQQLKNLITQIRGCQMCQTYRFIWCGCSSAWWTTGIRRRARGSAGRDPEIRLCFVVFWCQTSRAGTPD